MEAENRAALAIQGRWRRATHRAQPATMMPEARVDTEEELRDKLDDPAEGLLTNKEKLDECRNSLQLQCTMHLVASASFDTFVPRCTGSTMMLEMTFVFRDPRDYLEVGRL